MRGIRGLIVLLLIAAPLFWFTYRESRKPVETGEKHDKVFSVESDKIDAIEVKSESGERTKLQRKGTAWTFAEPKVEASPDEATVSGITSNLASMEIQRVVDDNPSDVAEFGLAAPHVEVAFSAGGRQHRLQLGQKTPTGTDLYAKIADEKRVFLVSSFLESTFNKGTFDLQDKSVLKLDREKVDALAISAGGRETSFAKVNGEWMLKSPVEARAEFSAVDGLVSRLGGLQMKAMAPSTPPAGGFGLDKPAATVRVGSGSSQATLAIGSAAPEGTVYARDMARPAIFTIESSLMDDLKKAPSDYRQKDLFDARSFNTTRIEIVRAGGTSTFEKVKAKDKDGRETEKWRQTTPAARDVDASTVEALLSAATAARATSFVPSPKAGLDRPELTITLKYDESKEDRVVFTRSGGSAWAAHPGSPDAAAIETSVLDGIEKALDAIK